MADAARLVGNLRDAFGKKDLADCKTLLAKIKVVLANLRLCARRAWQRAAFAIAGFLNRCAVPRSAALRERKLHWVPRGMAGVVRVCLRLRMFPALARVALAVFWAASLQCCHLVSISPIAPRCGGCRRCYDYCRRGGAPGWGEGACVR